MSADANLDINHAVCVHVCRLRAPALSSAHHPTLPRLILADDDVNECRFYGFCAGYCRWPTPTGSVIPVKLTQKDAWQDFNYLLI